MHKKIKEIIKETNQDLSEKKKENKRFQQAILNPKKGKVAIIGEIKLASPSAGSLGNIDEIESRVKEYEESGIDTVSIVTEKHFFKGDPKMIEIIRRVTSLPILQKDFIIDEYQIYETKNLGADAILLIARILSEKNLIKFVSLSNNIGIEPVVEVNSKDDLRKTLKTSTEVIAVNARDLDTFKVDVEKACKLLKQIPNNYIKLGFSGVQNINQINQYKAVGVKAVLIGTSLMKTKDIRKYVQSLRSSYDVKVKICGIRNLEAAKVAIESGADFLGFNFIPTSKRFISQSNAIKIINKIRGKAKLVGVFQDADIDYVKDVVSDLELDFVQLHGKENNEYINNVGISVIKSVTLNDRLQNIQAKYLLLDRIKRGEGEMVNLEQAAQLSANFPIFYAGGLNPDNVAEVIEQIQPFAVDVAGGIETNNVQDTRKIREFIKNAKGVKL